MPNTLIPISKDSAWNLCFNLLLDPTVSEIQSNGPDAFFIKKSGKRIHLENIKLVTDERYLKSIEEGLVPFMKSLYPFDPTGYLFEGPLEIKVGDQKIRGRSHVVLPPASDYAQVTIAKKSSALAQIEDIAARGSMSTEMLQFLRSMMEANLTFVVSGGTGAGKALHKSTPIPTPSGFSTVGELSVNDIIFDEKGRPTTIERKYCPNDQKSFTVSFSSGEKIKASAGHLWQVSEKASSSNEYENSRVLSTDELFGLLKLNKKTVDYAVQKLQKPVVFNERPLALSAYRYGFGLGQSYRRGGKGSRDLIADVYRYNSAEVRAELMRGLIESGAIYLSGDVYRVEEIHPEYSKDIREIVLSLGWHASAATNLGDFTFTRNPSKDRGFNKIVKIVEITDDPADYFCFQVDSPSHLFLCGRDFVPTHNTTMLEALSKLIRSDTRIGVAEDTPELSLVQPNVSYNHSVPWKPGMSENDVATLSWVVKQFQRMRVDRLIIGETRGKEFADFLIAANSGMDGSMTTIHANTPRSSLNKMTTFVLKDSQNEPIRSINQNIATSIDIIVQLDILSDGRHKIQAIEEITNTIGKGEDAQIATATLYQYDEDKDAWRKSGQMTDGLKDKFAKRGVSIENLMQSPVGGLQKSHGTTSADKRPVGLPTQTGRRHV